MLRVKWQEDRKGRSVGLLSRAAHETDTAMMLLHDVSGNPKPKPGTDVCFGGKERFKQAFASRQWNTGTRIENCDAYPRLEGVVPLVCLGHADNKSSARRHCVQGVADQI